jgi:hypothetical protein
MKVGLLRRCPAAEPEPKPEADVEAVKQEQPTAQMKFDFTSRKDAKAVRG